MMIQFFNKAERLLFLWPLISLVLLSCSSSYQLTGSADQRIALLEDIIALTEDREAFSEVKNEKLGLDIIDSMEAMRSEFSQAKSEHDLYYALVKLSNLRRDRHLRVKAISRGLRPENWPDSDPDPLISSIRFCPDYADPKDYFLFVCDIAKDLEDPKVSLGDRLLGVDEMSFPEYQEYISSYMPFSSVEGFWWKFAEMASLDHQLLPNSFDGEDVVYLLENSKMIEYKSVQKFRPINSVIFSGVMSRKYDAYQSIKKLETFELFKHTSKDILLLDWHGFRGDLVKDVDWLIRHAEKEELLDFAIIFDATKARGGSKGAYAIQRLFSKPFKTTFGNLKISDVIPVFVDRREIRYKRRMAMLDGGVSETADDGSWLTNWLVNDVREAYERKMTYTNSVPFKLAHAPKDSDGVLRPARKHFKGAMVVLLSPHGGSHLDQFAAIVKDNSLAPIIGMPAGGYSNTWEWTEELYMPDSEDRLLSYMWSIGHTIRPNGEILEGNPAIPDEYIPLTRENYRTYHLDLLNRGEEILRD